jgi:hypothetical protein
VIWRSGDRVIGKAAEKATKNCLKKERNSQLVVERSNQLAIVANPAADF